MKDNIKNIEASIRAKLLNIAKEEKLSFDFILLLFMQERLLYRLSVSEYKDHFILKGGLLILSTLSIKTRPTKDIDSLAKNISNDLTFIKHVFSQISKIHINDGIFYDTKSIEVTKITKDSNYNGVRIKITGYIGNIHKNIQLDLGFGDVVVPSEVVIEYPVLLDFDIPIIKAYSLESVIAEKFEAMLSLSVINSRMKDFYDIFELSKSNSFDGPILYEAIIATFKNRNTRIEKNASIFDENFSKDINRNKLWKSYLRKIKKDNLDFKVIMDNISSFLLPIYNSILKNTSFNGTWDNNKSKWLK